MTKIAEVIGSTLDIIFLFGILWFAFDQKTVSEAVPYMTLYGIWCCSMTLVKIRKIMEDDE